MLETFRSQTLHYVHNVTPEPMAMTLIIGVFMLLYGLYCYLVRPLNRVKNLGDLGFFFGHPEVCNGH